MKADTKTISLPISMENYKLLKTLVATKKVPVRNFITGLINNELKELKTNKEKAVKQVATIGLLSNEELAKHTQIIENNVTKIDHAKNNDMGVSEYTPIKEALFRQLLLRQINIVKAINHKYGENNIFNFYDINSGNGKYKLQGKTYNGSPLVLLKEVEKYPGVPFNILLYELNTSSCEKLQAHLDQKTYQNILNRGNVACTILNADHNTIDSYFQKIDDVAQFGCIYNDPNGNPNFDLLSKISKYPQNKKLDIFINCNTTSLKRTRRAAENKRDGYTKSNDPGLRSLEELLCGIDKNYWIIKKPEAHTGWRWTFLIGTNYNGQTSIPSPRKDFYIFKKNWRNKIIPGNSNKAKNAEAAEMFRFISLTKEELEC